MVDVQCYSDSVDAEAARHDDSCVPERDPILQRRLMGIGVRIRAARAHAGLTQEGLALAAGLHRTYIGQLESGDRNVAIGNLFKIADALEVPIGELVGP